jgi:hypothetical protein
MAANANVNFEVKLRARHSERSPRKTAARGVRRTRRIPWDDAGLGVSFPCVWALAGQSTAFPESSGCLGSEWLGKFLPLYSSFEKSIIL